MKVLVCFSAAGTAYAVPVEQTRRLVPALGLAPLPDPLPGVVGALRDDHGILPVIDTLAPGASRSHPLVLVLEVDGQRFGVLVEGVSEVRHVSEDDLAPAPAGQRARLVRGVVSEAEGAPMVIDAGTLAQELVA